MRKLILVVGSMLSVVGLAASTAFAGVGELNVQADLAKVEAITPKVETPEKAQETSKRILRYDFTVTRMNKTAPTAVAPVEVQKGSIEVLENQPSFSQSTTQQAYACLSKDKASLTSCTVSYGYMFGVEGSEMDPATGKTEAKVTLAVSDLEAMHTHQTSVGELSEPILASFHVEQKAVLTPGKSMFGVHGEYAYKVTLVDVR